MTEPTKHARPSPELLAVLESQRRYPPSLTALRLRDVAIREAIRRSPADRARRRAWREANSYDWTAMANNARRLKKLEDDYESGRRCDRPRDLEDKS